MNPDDQDLSRLIRQHATRHPAPEVLRASIRTQAALQAAARPPDKSLLPRAAWWRVLNWPSASAGAFIGVALTLVLGTVIVPRIEAQWATPSLESEIVSNHVHSMGIGPMIEVASSDRHTVKPWFQGKLDFAPPVPDLSVEGFTLLGGRVERLGGRAVATLAYTRNRHVFNVYVWPAEHPVPPQAVLRKGFNLRHWSEGSMQVWVVSDVEASEVEHFSAAWRGWVQGSSKAAE